MTKYYCNKCKNDKKWKFRVLFNKQNVKTVVSPDGTAVTLQKVIEKVVLCKNCEAIIVIE